MHDLRAQASAAMAKASPAFTPADFQDAWRKVEKAVIARFEKPGRGQTKRQARVFEVHHSIEHARTKFLQAIVDGHSPQDCKLLALPTEQGA